MLDILAPMHDCRRWSASVSYAAGLAAALGGSLTGLCVSAGDDDAAPVPLQAELAEIVCNDRECCRDASVQFVRWAQRRHVSRARWYATTQALDAALRTAADWHDLAVVERPSDDAGPSIYALGGLLIDVPLPFVLLPPDLPEDTPPPATIAVAWNGSREVMRALHAALPLLRRASRVVLVHSPALPTIDDASWPRVPSVADYLHWQNIDGEFVTETLADPKALFAAMADIDADLLVMGAYGRGRQTEWLFGGATDLALRRVRTPLFLRH